MRLRNTTAIFIISFTLWLPVTSAYGTEAERDRVTNLPGLNETFGIDHFAGFVSLSPRADDPVRRDMFYWFVESESPTRATDPLVLWTNGGPGCSGLLGLLSENGPFRPAEGGRVLDRFPYSWTQAASVIFVEQPLFVGFSLSDDAGDSATNDDLNAQRLVTFLLNWLDRFPEYKDRDLYLASESYGGHYVPTTAQHILDHNAAALLVEARRRRRRRRAASSAAEESRSGRSVRRTDDHTRTPETAAAAAAAAESDDEQEHEAEEAGDAEAADPLERPLPQFRGFLVGNPYTNVAEGNKGLMGALWGHGLLATPQYREWAATCDDGDATDDAGSHCAWLPWAYWASYVGDDAANPYGLSYPTCTTQHEWGEQAGEEGDSGSGTPDASAGEKRSGSGVSGMEQRFRLLDLIRQHSGYPPAASSASSSSSSSPPQGQAAGAAPTAVSGLYEPCREAYLTAYLNRPDVREALHVDHDRPWAECDDGIWDDYDPASSARPMEEAYADLLSRTSATPRAYRDVYGLRKPLKMLVYSGDDDAVCGTQGTVSWLFALPDVLPGRVNVSSYWAPWRYAHPLYGPQLGGFYTALQGLHFATVHGAGHEVPAFKPEAALALFAYFLQLNDTASSAAAAKDTDGGGGGGPFPAPFELLALPASVGYPQPPEAGAEGGGDGEDTDEEDDTDDEEEDRRHGGGGRRREERRGGGGGASGAGAAAAGAAAAGGGVAGFLVCLLVLRFTGLLDCVALGDRQAAGGGEGGGGGGGGAFRAAQAPKGFSSVASSEEDPSGGTGQRSVELTFSSSATKRMGAGKDDEEEGAVVCPLHAEDGANGEGAEF